LRYLLIICDDPLELKRMTDAERARIVADYRTFTQSIVRSGNFRGGESLKPATTATTIRVRGGTRLLTDGPFAETKEQLAGYVLVEARDLDEAIAIAERIPAARFGAVEVRPVTSFGE